MTRDELLDGRTDTPFLENEAFRMLLIHCWAAVEAEDYVKRGKKRRRGCSRKQVETADASFHNTDFDFAELR